ncbi:MAG: hypothetical protein IPK89_13750 [Sphingomonadales bacterium]|nr:hypothetical protein [Sphingomonadales bacterium]
MPVIDINDGTGGANRRIRAKLEHDGIERDSISFGKRRAGEFGDLCLTALRLEPVTGDLRLDVAGWIVFTDATRRIHSRQGFAPNALRRAFNAAYALSPSPVRWEVIEPNSTMRLFPPVSGFLPRSGVLRFPGQ